MANESPDLGKPIMTRADVCAEFGLSPAHLSRLQAQAKIPFFKMGRLVRFSRAELATWCENGGTRQWSKTQPKVLHGRPGDLLPWERKLKSVAA